MTRTDLPINGQLPAERADAVRNRRRILDAAATLLAEQGVAAVTMNAVAHAAGIGVGTVYRRFGDVGQLLLALLDDGERQFQEAFMTGPPPLGPGAPPTDRLRAFLHALADRVVEAGTILRAAEAVSPQARYRHGPYIVKHTHVSLLLRQIRPESEPALLAHLLLAPLAPSLIEHLRGDCGRSQDEIKAGIDHLLALEL